VKVVIISWVIPEHIKHNSNHFKITSALEARIVKWSEVAEGRYRVAAHRTGLYSMNFLCFLRSFSYEVILCLNGTDTPTGPTFHPTDDK
jgi:hypothetical protein